MESDFDLLILDDLDHTHLAKVRIDIVNIEVLDSILFAGPGKISS